MDSMTQKLYSPQEWLTYYKNDWTRRVVAMTVDVECDTAAKAINPDKQVPSTEGGITTVKERLEARKMGLASGLRFIEALDTLLEIPDDQFVAKCWSTEALSVAADMLPPAKQGDACTMPDGTAGVLGADLVTCELPAPVAAPAEAPTAVEGEAAVAPANQEAPAPEGAAPDAAAAV